MRTVLGLAVAGLAVCSLAACTSSSSGGGPSAGPSSSASSATSASAGTPVAPSTLAASLQRGLRGVDSLHLTLTTAVAGSAPIRGSGDVALSGGRISQADISEQLPGGLGSVRLLVAGGHTYARLPAGLTKSDKPWLRLSSSSSEPVVAQLAQTVDSVLAVASPSTVVTFVRAASSVRDLGPGKVGATPATQYRVVIPAGKLTGLPGGLSAGSASTVPVQLFVDRSHRPVQLRGSIELSGARLTPTVGLSRFGEQVSIQAPPASQIAAG